MRPGATATNLIRIFEKHQANQGRRQQPRYLFKLAGAPTHSEANRPALGGCGHRFPWRPTQEPAMSEPMPQPTRTCSPPTAPPTHFPPPLASRSGRIWGATSNSHLSTPRQPTHDLVTSQSLASLLLGASQESIRSAPTQSHVTTMHKSSPTQLST